MKYIQLIFVGVISFVAGYIFKGFTSSDIVSKSTALPATKYQNAIPHQPAATNKKHINHSTSAQSNTRLANNTNSGITEAVISPNEASILPYPYSEIVVEQKGWFADAFHQLQLEQVDTGWADKLERQIWDHFTTHTLAHSVNLASVKCASSTCEFMGIDVAPRAWKTIYQDMKKQDWYVFGNSVFSTKQESNQKEEYFYVLSSS